VARPVKEGHTPQEQTAAHEKKLLIATALVLVSASAQARSWSDGSNRVVVPKGCASWSCMSVSVPGHYSHNVKPEKKVRIRHSAR